MWISLGSELFRCGKLRERMTKEQSNGVVPENLEQPMGSGALSLLRSRGLTDVPGSAWLSSGRSAS
jgi:hypothetical protein